jgi:hypothetical protein
MSVQITGAAPGLAVGAEAARAINMRYGRDIDALMERARNRPIRAGRVALHKYEYRHRWALGDMVIWDNRSVLHQANADYDMRQKRLMYRLMVRGESPIAA